MWRTFTTAIGLYLGSLTVAFGQSEEIAVVVIEGPFILKGSYVVGHVISRTNEVATFRPCKGSQIDVKGDLLIETDLKCSDQPGEPKLLAENCLKVVTESIATSDIDLENAEIGEKYSLAVPEMIGGFYTDEAFSEAITSGICSDDFVSINGVVGVPLHVLQNVRAQYYRQ